MQSNINTLRALKRPFYKMRAALIVADLKIALRTNTPFTMPALNVVELGFILDMLSENHIIPTPKIQGA